MKNKKCVFCTIVAIAVAIAAIALIVTYRDEIADFFASAKEKCIEKKSKFCCCHKDCSEDFADI